MVSLQTVTDACPIHVIIWQVRGGITNVLCWAIRTSMFKPALMLAVGSLWFESAVLSIGWLFYLSQTSEFALVSFLKRLGGLRRMFAPSLQRLSRNWTYHPWASGISEQHQTDS